jgi:ribosomal protein S18 acetylase RimI-like enzyme
MARLHGDAFERSWSAAEMAEMLGAAEALALVAHAAGEEEAIGFVLARCIAGDSEVLSIAVAHGWRRRGVAGALMAALIEEVRARAATDLFLEVDIANKAARALYGGLGFIEAGRRRNYYSTPMGPSDALVLRLELAQGMGSSSNMLQKPL